jgi:hypothetical protein
MTSTCCDLFLCSLAHLVRLPALTVPSKAVFWFLVSVLLATYVCRTRLRSLDWESEETLFEKAYEVSETPVR